MTLAGRWAGLHLKVKDVIARHGMVATVAVVLPHLAALALMLFYEVTVYSIAVYTLTWGLLNFFWLIIFRRAAVAATLSLIVIGSVVALSDLKFGALWLQLSFVDVLIVDTDTAEYVLSLFPWLGWLVAAIAAASLLLLVLVWRFDPTWIRLRNAFAGFAACFMAVAVLCSAVELDPLEGYHGNKYVSFFVRSAVLSVSELATRGMLDSDVAVVDRLKPVADLSCKPTTKLPHIILVHDESSFDIRSAPGIKVPPGFHRVQFEYFPYDGFFGLLLTAFTFTVPLIMKKIGFINQP